MNVETKKMLKSILKTQEEFSIKTEIMFIADNKRIEVTPAQVNGIYDRIINDPTFITAINGFIEKHF